MVDGKMSETTAATLLTAIVKGELRPLVEMLAGYETALMAVLGRLDASGVLPASEAKAAIDGAYALLTDENKKSGQGTILRQLSEGLQPRARRH